MTGLRVWSRQVGTYPPGRDATADGEPKGKMLATRRAGFSPGLFGKQSPEALSGIASQPELGAGRIELNGAAKGGNVRVLNPGPLHDATAVQLSKAVCRQTREPACQRFPDDEPLATVDLDG